MHLKIGVSSSILRDGKDERFNSSCKTKKDGHSDSFSEYRSRILFLSKFSFSFQMNSSSIEREYFVLSYLWFYSVGVDM